MLIVLLPVMIDRTSITITNHGSESLQITGSLDSLGSIICFGVSLIEGCDSIWPLSIGPGGNSEFYLYVNVSAGPRSLSTNLIFTHNFSSSPDTIPISGKIRSGIFVLDPELEFGNVIIDSSVTEYLHLERTSWCFMTVQMVSSSSNFVVPNSVYIQGPSASVPLTFTPTEDYREVKKMVLIR